MAINPLISLQARGPDVGSALSNAILNVQRINQIRQSREQAAQSQQDNKLALKQAALKQMVSIAPAVESAALAGDINSLRALSQSMPQEASLEMSRLIELGDFSVIATQAQRLNQLAPQLGITGAAKQTANQRDFETFRNLPEGDEKDAFGRMIGVLPTATQEAAADIRRESLELRKQDAEIRRLEAQERREANSLKKEELQRQIQTEKRNQKFEADSAFSNVDATIGTVDRLLEGEGLESASGVSSAFPTLPGTEAANFEAELETLQSQTFLAQVEKMKGLGALSENEGKKLAAAIGALSLSMSDRALRASLGRIRDTLTQARINLQKKFGRPESQQDTPPDGGRVGRFTVLVEAP